MMGFERFTEEAQEAAQLSATIIGEYGHNTIDTEHLLLTLIEQKEGRVRKILKGLNVNHLDLWDRLNTILLALPKDNLAGAKPRQIFITPRVKRIIDLANQEAFRFDKELISTEHIILAILAERNTPTSRILESAGLNRDKVHNYLVREMQEKKKAQPSDQAKTKTIPTASKSISTRNKNVFIVHGHDEAMKQAVARTVEKLGFHAIVLHEKPNQGKTIIEKFTEYSDVGFAIVLLSPDDICLFKEDSIEKKRFRARQNVIFELGFFIGKLGRGRVISLYRQTGDFDLPSDYSGVLFVPFDEYYHWRLDLMRELKASGYKIDANKLLE